MMTATPLMQLTRTDGSKIVVVKAAMVSWSEDINKPGTQRVCTLDARFQDVTETADQISAMFIKGL